MNNWQAQVKDFHLKMGLESSNSPKMLSNSAKARRVSLIGEELLELSRALYENDMIESIDALCDLMYVVLGTAVELGVDLEEYFEEVHFSNMTKVGGHKNEFGKFIKPDTYTPPNLHSILKRERMKSVKPLVVDGEISEDLLKK